MPYKIFISYDSKNDKNEMEVLKNLINENSTMDPIVLTDEERNSPHKLFSDKVNEGIDECDLIMPILSKQSLKSQWVNQEIGYAYAKEKDFCALIEKGIRDDLKGLIHRESDLPYTFKKSSSSSTELESFSKCAKAALDHISNEKILIGKMLGPFTSPRYSPAVDIYFKTNVDEKLFFKAKITRTRPSDQSARVYYRLYDPSIKLKYWIAFKIDNKSKEGIVNSTSESAISIHSQERVYEINENIYQTIQTRGIKFNRIPPRIDRVRLRGCREIFEPVELFFEFTK